MQPTKVSYNEGKVEEAVKAYEKVKQSRRILKVHNKLVNDPLPPHKQKKHELLLSDKIVETRNAQAALDGLLKKLKHDDMTEFTRRCNMLELIV